MPTCRYSFLDILCSQYVQENFKMLIDIISLYYKIFPEIKYLRIFKNISEEFKYKILLGLNYTAYFYLSALYPNRNMSGTQWK